MLAEPLHSAEPCRTRRPCPAFTTPSDEVCVTCGRAPGVRRPVPLRTVHCGPCWAQFGGSPEAAEIGPPPLQALCSRDPRDQREWPELLAAEQWVQLLRRDCRDKLLRMVRELTLTAHWDTWESWPGWDRLIEVTGWARSTMAGWLRQLRLLGWLATIESGSTPQFRPLALAHVEGNRRAVYALRVPLRPAEPLAELEARAHAACRSVPAGVGAGWDLGGYRAVERTWTPTWFFGFSSLVDQWVSSRARDFFHNSQVTAQVESKKEALRARLDEKWLAFAGRVPTSRAQMLAAAAELRRQHPVLARLSIRATRALCRPYWHAGWTNNDVLHALEYRPTSWSRLPAMPLSKILAPYRWTQSRLSAWHTDTGRILPGHSHTERERHVREHVLVARHGQAALDALPPGAAQLRPLDVRRYGRGRVHAAVETLRRRRAAELSDRRAVVWPPDHAASPEHRSRMSAKIHAERERRQVQRAEMHERLLAQARAAQTKRQDHTEPQTFCTPPEPVDTPQDRHELALARARAEGRLPLTRRRRRRSPW